MFAREELFHMDRRAIDYTAVVNGEMADAYLDVVYQSFPYMIGSMIVAVSMYAMSILMDIPRAWNQSWLDTGLFISSVIGTIIIGYVGFLMIGDLDACLEKAKNDRLQLLAKIEALEKEKESMRMIFTKMVAAISEDEFKKLTL